MDDSATSDDAIGIISEAYDITLCVQNASLSKGGWYFGYVY